MGLHFVLEFAGWLVEDVGVDGELSLLEVMHQTITDYLNLQLNLIGWASSNTNS